MSVTVRDGVSVDDTDTFTWTVTNTNQAPVFSTDIGDQTDAEGDAVSLDADATDADLDTLTYSATGLPAGVIHRRRARASSAARCQLAARRQPTTSIITGQRRHATDTDTFTWTVTNTNQAPVFSTEFTDRTDAEGAVISFDADATDPDAGTRSPTAPPTCPTASPSTAAPVSSQGTLSAHQLGHLQRRSSPVSDGTLTDTDTLHLDRDRAGHRLGASTSTASNDHVTLRRGAGAQQQHLHDRDLVPPRRHGHARDHQRHAAA